MKKSLVVLALLMLASCKTLTQPNVTMQSEIVNEQAAEELPLEEQPAIESSVVSHRSYALHEVGSLDTVASIARKYDISSDQLIKINNLAPPYILRPGSVIKVPAFIQPSTSAIETPDDEGIRTIHIKPKGNSN